MKIYNLLPSIKKLFWEVKADTVFDARYKKEIIVKTLNYGNLKDWKWIKKEFGTDEIFKVLNMPRCGVREEADRLARVMFG